MLNVSHSNRHFHTFTENLKNINYSLDTSLQNINVKHSRNMSNHQQLVIKMFKKKSRKLLLEEESPCRKSQEIFFGTVLHYGTSVL